MRAKLCTVREVAHETNREGGTNTSNLRRFVKRFTMIKNTFKCMFNFNIKLNFSCIHSNKNLDIENK